MEKPERVREYAIFFQKFSENPYFPTIIYSEISKMMSKEFCITENFKKYIALECQISE